MVEIFKTNVESYHEAKRLVDVINIINDNYAVNFDLDDCDNILRIESTNSTINIETVEKLLKTEGYYCSLLE